MLKPKNKKNLVLIISLIFIITLINYSIKKTNNSEDESKNKSINNLIRLQALKRSYELNGKTFPELSLRTLSLDCIGEDLFTESIIIVLSNQGCNPCQISILKKIDSLAINMQGSVNFFGIYDGIDENEIYYLKKLSNSHIPIHYTEGNKLIKLLSTYPSILYISNQKIVSSFYPVPEDEKFTKWYLDILKENLL